MRGGILRSMKRTVTGFTIVELLIVIVVIAILAAISVVAYNGIQQRSQNAKIVSGVRDWAQIIRMYKADSGEYPTMTACLGGEYGRGFTNVEAAGGHCRQDNSGGGMINMNPAFVSLMAPYVNSMPPAPSLLVSGSADYPWYKGAYFYPWYAGNKARIDYILAGSSTSCPSIAGLEHGGTFASPATNTVRCTARFPDSPS